MPKCAHKCMITSSVCFSTLWCRKTNKQDFAHLCLAEKTTHLLDLCTPRPKDWALMQLLPPVLCADGESSSQTDWGSSLALILGRDAEDPLALPWRWEEDLIIGCYLCVTATRSSNSVISPPPHGSGFISRSLLKPKHHIMSCAAMGSAS